MAQINECLECLCVSSERIPNINYDEVADTFRNLRNACAQGSAVQNEIVAKLDVTKTRRIITHLLSLEGEEPQLCLQIAFQCLANLSVNNKENQLKVWSSFEDLIRNGLQVKHFKVQNSCGMIVYNVFLGHPELLDQLSDPLTDLFELTLNEATSEFAVYTLEHFILQSDYVVKFFKNLQLEHRLILIEILNTLMAKKDELETKLSHTLVMFFVDYFNKNANCILKTVADDVDDLEPVEVVKILDLLVAFTSDNDDVYLPYVQQNKSLLINSVFLLKSIHNVSKESGNNFSMIQKIADLNQLQELNNIESHPAFGFKASLIRLIGNMCWKNVENQNEIRELGCIPLLLDCCNIDGRNPFIIQWTILAIRNICEKNVENQRIIASVSQTGEIDSSQLQDLAITLNTDDEGRSVSLAPLVKK